jgi:hypothetical protein
MKIHRCLNQQKTAKEKRLIRYPILVASRFFRFAESVNPTRKKIYENSSS